VNKLNIVVLSLYFLFLDKLYPSLSSFFRSFVLVFFFFCIAFCERHVKSTPIQ